MKIQIKFDELEIELITKNILTHGLLDKYSEIKERIISFVKNELAHLKDRKNNELAR